MWPGHKRHSKRKGWYVPYGKRYRSTAMTRAFPQKVLFYSIENGLQRR